ncbi:MAG: hypothetical protein M3362_23965 [Acidobacteriota bacterium]|nr:hypothetical protein [Acidobacteriota bacterium]
MPVSYRIDPEEKIVYLTTVGDSSLAEWTEVMLTVLTDPSYQPGFNFLSDRRGESDVPSVEFAQGAASFLKLHRKEMGSFRWAAVSDRPAIYGMQRMFAVFSEMKGIQAEVFSDFENARQWLLR